MARMTDKQILSATKRARQHLHDAEGYDPTGGHYKAVDLHFDRVEKETKLRTSPPPAKWRNVGPVQTGGVSLLDMSLTHDTSGIPRFPAVDTAWGGGGGVTVIAPEDCVVDTKDTSSSPGEAVYLTGASGLRHWVGHLDRDWPLGKKFAKGAIIGKTLPIPGRPTMPTGASTPRSCSAKASSSSTARTATAPTTHWGRRRSGSSWRR